MHDNNNALTYFTGTATIAGINDVVTNVKIMAMHLKKCAFC
jgi:hypothetical protein